MSLNPMFQNTIWRCSYFVRARLVKGILERNTSHVLNELKDYVKSMNLEYVGAKWKVQCHLQRTRHTLRCYFVILNKPHPIIYNYILVGNLDVVRCKTND
jgi:hypothetical protein